jgi:lysophospholipase L1-like esterase
VTATSRSEPRTYVALGDSFTAGVPGAERRWADELAELLGVPEYRNLGVPGATSGEVAAGQLDECVDLEPDLVTLICGANDVLHSVRPDIEAYAATFGRMLARLRRELPAAAVLTATTPDLSTFMPLRPRSRRRVERGMRELNEATRAVARRHRVPCLEFAEHPRAGDRANFADDGFHPSPEGNRRAALAFALALDLDIDNTQEVTA